MHNMLPKLLEDTLNSILKTDNVHKWKLVSGHSNTLVIHFENKGCHIDSGEIYHSNSMYKRKTPSQVRRDQRRSDNWRALRTPDSGFKSTPGNRNDVQLDSFCDNAVDKELHVNMDKPKHKPTDIIECSQPCMDNVHTTSIGTGCVVIQSPTHHGPAMAPLNNTVQFEKGRSTNISVESVSPQETPEQAYEQITSHDLNLASSHVTAISDDVSSSTPVDVPPINATMHFAKDSFIDFPIETTKLINHQEEKRAIPTFERPTTVRFSNVTVASSIKPRERDTPKKYINVKFLKQGGGIDIASLYYCKNCHIDLKQSGVSDCAWRTDKSNLCRKCCLSSKEMCPICYETDFDK